MLHHACTAFGIISVSKCVHCKAQTIAKRNDGPFDSVWRIYFALSWEMQVRNKEWSLKRAITVQWNLTIKPTHESAKMWSSV